MKGSMLHVFLPRSFLEAVGFLGVFPAIVISENECENEKKARY